MDEALYQRFLELSATGHKLQTKERVRRFVDALASFEEKQQWTREFLSRADFKYSILHEIYAEVIFPVLERGFEAGDFQSTLWLAHTIENVYPSRDLHERVGWATESTLLRRAFELRPQDENVCRLLLRNLLDWLDYCEHEWPTGILYGNHGATLEECQIIAREVDFARNLDSQGEHKEFFDEFEIKLRQYQRRLNL